MRDLRIVPFLLVHKDRIPIFQDQTILLHESRQNQNTPPLQEINEFQIFLANPKKIFQYVHHKRFLDPNRSNVKWPPKSTSPKTQYVSRPHLRNSKYPDLL